MPPWRRRSAIVYLIATMESCSDQILIATILFRLAYCSCKWFELLNTVEDELQILRPAMMLVKAKEKPCHFGQIFVIASVGCVAQ